MIQQLEVGGKRKLGVKEHAERKKLKFFSVRAWISSGEE